MNCPVCHTPIPEHHLACPVCAQRRSYEAVLDLQKAFLPSLLRGEHPLTLAKPSEEMDWHVALLCYNELAWCGRTISPQWKKQYREYPDLFHSRLCRWCRAALDRLAKEVSPEVA